MPHLFEINMQQEFCAICIKCLISFDDIIETRIPFATQVPWLTSKKRDDMYVHHCALIAFTRIGNVMKGNKEIDAF